MTGIPVFDEIAVSFPFGADALDIGGTNSAGSDDTVHWVDMSGYDEIGVLVQIGTWNATDDLDTCKLEQATSSAGAGKKDLTTSASGGNYDTDNPIDAATNKVFLAARSEDLDAANGFRYVRVYLAEGGNTGVDNVQAVYVRRKARFAQADINGAASTGVLQYATP